MSQSPRNRVTQAEQAGQPTAAPTSRATSSLFLLACCAGFLFLAFVALGTWQVYRLQWKLDLIARVNARVNAAPTPAPDHTRWPLITAASDEYRRVTLTGRYLYAKTVPVQASTDLGSGSWLVTPLQLPTGEVVMVNRGFVPVSPIKLIASTTPDSAADNQAQVVGLLRISEEGGGFLRKNAPAEHRWYSRDVQAIATAQGFTQGQVAPYFVDADRASALANAENAPDQVKPVGGLTVIAFANSHLQYALTWYALALMIAGAGFWVVRDEKRRRARA